MIENIIISWCLLNGMVYYDYYVTRGGRIIFVAMKGNLYKSYIVRNLSPFRVESFDKKFSNSGF